MNSSTWRDLPMPGSPERSASRPVALGPATRDPLLLAATPPWRARAHEAGERLRLQTVTDGAAAQDDVPRRRLRHALEREQTERLQVEVAADELRRVAADHHLAGRTLRLQTRRDVRYLSPHVGRPFLAPGRDRCDHDLARVDADAGLELGESELGWQLAGELRHLLDDLESGVHRVAARRLDRDRDTRSRPRPRHPGTATPRRRGRGRRRRRGAGRRRARRASPRGPWPTPARSNRPGP